MEKINSINISGLGRFNNEEINFEPGINILERPNGWGKTTVLVAIKWCLGLINAKSSEIQNLKNRSNPLMVVMSIGKNKIVRTESYVTFDGKKKKGDKELREELGIDENTAYKLFPEMLFLNSKLTNKDRKKIFLSNLGILDKQAKLLEELTKKRNIEIDNLDTAYETISSELKFAKTTLDQQKTIVAAKEEQFNNVSQGFEQSASDKKRADILKTSLKEQEQKIKILNDDIKKSKTEYEKALKSQEGKIALIEKAEKIIENEELKLKESEIKAAELKSKYALLKQNHHSLETGVCPVCGNKNPGEKVKELEEELKKLLEEAGKMKIEIDAQKEKNEEYKKKLKEHKIKLNEFRVDVKNKVTQNTTLEKELSSTNEKITTLKEELKAYENEVHSLLEILKEEIELELEKLKTFQGIYEAAKNKMDFIILELFPRMEEIVIENYSPLFFKGISVKFSRMNSTTQEIVEDFGIMFVTENGTIPYESLSEGYRKMADIELAANMKSDIILMDSFQGVSLENRINVTSRIKAQFIAAVC